MIIKKSLRSNQGFSLLEIVIVVALIGLLAALGSSFYGNFTKSVDLDSAARSIVSDLKAAQAQAMSGGDSDANGISDKWGVCFRNPSTGDTNGRYQIYSAPTYTCAANSESITLKSTIYLPAGITFTVPADGASVSVVFDKITGTPTLTGGSDVRITGNGQTKTITITAAGLVSSN